MNECNAFSCFFLFSFGRIWMHKRWHEISSDCWPHAKITEIPLRILNRTKKCHAFSVINTAHGLFMGRVLVGWLIVWNRINVFGVTQQPASNIHTQNVRFSLVFNCCRCRWCKWFRNLRTIVFPYQMHTESKFSMSEFEFDKFKFRKWDFERVKLYALHKRSIRYIHIGTFNMVEHGMICVWHRFEDLFSNSLPFER